jgi:N-glycosidase YbiA
VCETNSIYFYSANGPYGWLANFSEHEISIGGKKWKSVEHYFQAMKFNDWKMRALIAEAETPDLAKKIAKRFRLKKRSDWGRIKNLVMYNAIRAKFTQHPDLFDALKQTGSQTIVEAATNDDYWGYGRDHRGRNQMGKLLMRLRSRLMRGWS